MIKKLMNISGAQVLGKEELKNVMGGQWIIVCPDGQRFYASPDDQMAIDQLEFMCPDGYLAKIG